MLIGYVKHVHVFSLPIKINICICNQQLSIIPHRKRTIRSVCTNFTTRWNMAFIPWRSKMGTCDLNRFNSLGLQPSQYQFLFRYRVVDPSTKRTNTRILHKLLARSQAAYNSILCTDWRFNLKLFLLDLMIWTCKK